MLPETCQTISYVLHLDHPPVPVNLLIMIEILIFILCLEYHK
jgi:hypothetical protein